MTAAPGWIAGARRVPSPNFDARPAGATIDLVVTHYISLPPGCFRGDAIERLFTNRLVARADPSFEALRGLRVSTHFLIRRRGQLLQFVATDDRAWHAGASRFMDRERCNDFSIGIELEGSDEAPFESPQYRALARLIQTLRRRYPIEDIVGHADVAPDRKTDPGPHFDWAQLRRLLARREA